MNTVLLLLIFISRISPKHCMGERIGVTVPVLWVSVQARFSCARDPFHALALVQNGGWLHPQVVVQKGRDSCLPSAAEELFFIIIIFYQKVVLGFHSLLEHNTVSKCTDVTSDTPFLCQHYSHAASPVLMLQTKLPKQLQ